MNVTFLKNRLPLLGISIVAIVAMSFWPGQSSEFNLPNKVDFNKHIRPILSQNCYVCHGNDPGSRKAGLRLDNLEGATAKLKSGGVAIVPGNLRKSQLVQRISSNDVEFRMPPPEAKKTLAPKQIALLKRWIKQGAQWKPHWALVKPEMPKFSSPILKSNVAERINYLVDRQLKNQKLKSTHTATKNALIRRVSYLLTGLPPTPEELTNFLNDQSENCYENMVDDFLTSKSYGERWARHWMDLVRYAESMGHEADHSISGSWQYRDYLIRAFNQDVPYDLFVKEHLAGDMLKNPRSNPEKGFNESIIGTAYMFLGDGKPSPVDIKAEEADRIDNIIEVTSKTFQALTVACARCHDHKFDPIPSADYYAMYGIIESSRLVPKAAKQQIDQERQLEKIQEIKGRIKESIGKQLMAHQDKLTAGELSKLKNYLEEGKQSKESKLDSNIRILEDFRDGDWKDWYTDGIAFGDRPGNGELLIDHKTQKPVGVANGFASSRIHSAGLQGVLHSPNFIMGEDSILVRARGVNGTIRLIIDNFHIIEHPLWHQLEAQVNDEKWKNYILSAESVKGHKAYLEFLPGTFERHVFNIQPSDYVEIQYAVRFTGDYPIHNRIAENASLPLTQKEISQAIQAWMNGKASQEQMQIVSALIKSDTQQPGAGELADLVDVYGDIAQQLYDPTLFIGLTEGDGVASPVFNRGNVRDFNDEIIPHRFFTAIDAGPASFPQDGSGRLSWAEAVVDPENPLTSRVIVNRIWHHIFGRGIVETVDNFGLQGHMPSNPELLDFLAIQFISDGWSIKSMIRNIMLTETFQRSAVPDERSDLMDPENIYLHKFPIRRLEAEAIRDGILAVSGCLDDEMYGEGIRVYLSEFMTGRGRPLISGPMDSYGRRSIYRTVRRNFIPEMMLTFDMPIPFSTFGRRNTTNVPAQSLALLNDPFVHEQALYWAENLLKFNKLTVIERINAIYLRAFSREPNSDEIKQALTFLANQATEYGTSVDELKNNVDVWMDYCHSVFNLKEFIHLL